MRQGCDLGRKCIGAAATSAGFHCPRRVSRWRRSCCYAERSLGSLSVALENQLDAQSLHQRASSAVIASRRNFMELNTLRDLYVYGLKDVYSAEKQITKALPKMIRAASSPDLQKALEKHLAV